MAAVKINFNTSSVTQGSMYKLQKFACHYSLRKFAFCTRTVNMWNSLPNVVVESDTINTFKNRLDRHWSNQEGLFDFNADLTGILDNRGADKQVLFQFCFSVRTFETSRVSCDSIVDGDWLPAT